MVCLLGLNFAICPISAAAERAEVAHPKRFELLTLGRRQFGLSRFSHAMEGDLGPLT